MKVLRCPRMSRAHPSVIRALHTSIRRGSSLLIAVSGGVDSVVLLHALLELRGSLSLTLEVGHVNHRLRAEASADASFVEGLAKAAGVPFHLHVVDEVPPHANIEQWARRVRYEALQAVRGSRGLGALVTAHQADDQAEGLCMKALANKELRGVAAYDPRRALLRPLLGVPRAAILEYARSAGLVWREDESNADVRFLRNRVRSRLLPFLREEFGERVVESLATRAEALNEDLGFLNRLVEPVAARIPGPFGSKEWFRALQAELRELPEALQWRLVELSLLGSVGFPLGRRVSKEVVQFVLGQAEGQQLPAGLSLRREGGGLRIQTRSSVIAPEGR